MPTETEQEQFVKKAKRIEAKVAKLWNRHDRLNKIFSKSGGGFNHIDKGEGKRLDAIVLKIAQLEQNLKEGYAKHHVYIDPVPIHGEASIELGKIMDFREDQFFNMFHTSLRLWAVSLKGAMSAVRDYMDGYGGSKTGQLNLTDVVVLGTLVAPAITFVGTAHTVATVVEKGIRANFKAKKSDKPTINEIQRARRFFLGEFEGDEPLHKSMFTGFVMEYMYKNNIDMESWSGWEKPFADACRGFAADNLISSDAYEKEFISEILRNTQNDDRNEGEDEAGEAELTWAVERDNWMIPDTAFEFTSMKRQLDDVSEAVLEGVKTVSSGKLVIDLPVEINVKVIGLPLSLKKEKDFRAARKSREMGSTNFELVSGNKEVYDEIMRPKVYEQIKVKDLNYDD